VTMPQVRTVLQPTDWTYTFGPLSAPVLVLNTTDAAGVVWFADEPEGWAAAPTSTATDPRPYGDRSFAGDTYLEERVLTFADGFVEAPTQALALAAWDQLLAVAQTRVEILYTQQETPPRSLYLRAASGQPKRRWLSDTAFEFSLIMVAEDPLKFSATEAAATVSTMLPMPAEGRVYNRTYPYTYPPTTTQGSVRLTNSGNEDAPSVITLRGYLDHPVVGLDSTGEFVGLDVVLGVMDTATIDSRNALVTINGQVRYDALIPGSSFLTLPPGDNTLRLSHADAYNTTALMTVSAPSTWK